MRPYAIARYLSEAQIDRALAAEYALTDVGREADGTPVFALWTTDAARACPLGVALKLRPTPNQTEVMRALAPNQVELMRTLAPSRYDEAIRRAAWRFIRANDSGKITPENLPAALGRPRSCPA